MIRDYDIEYSENGIVRATEDNKLNYAPFDFAKYIQKYQTIIEEYLMFACAVKNYLKVKGDMLVMENISRKKNKKDFENIMKFIKRNVISSLEKTESTLNVYQ